MKICPVCKSRCFDDMDVCYGCMYDFSKENKGQKKNNNNKKDYNKDITINALNTKIIVRDNENINTNKNPCKINKSIGNHCKNKKYQKFPEYFEVDSFPIIEDSKFFNKKAKMSKYFFVESDRDSSEYLAIIDALSNKYYDKPYIENKFLFTLDTKKYSNGKIHFSFSMSKIDLEELKKVIL